MKLTTLLGPKRPSLPMRPSDVGWRGVAVIAFTHYVRIMNQRRAGGATYENATLSRADWKGVAGMLLIVAGIVLVGNSIIDVARRRA